MIFAQISTFKCLIISIEYYWLYLQISNYLNTRFLTLHSRGFFNCSKKKRAVELKNMYYMYYINICDEILLVKEKLQISNYVHHICHKLHLMLFELFLFLKNLNLLHFSVSHSLKCIFFDFRWFFKILLLLFFSFSPKAYYAKLSLNNFRYVNDFFSIAIFSLFLIADKQICSIVVINISISSLETKIVTKITTAISIVILSQITIVMIRTQARNSPQFIQIDNTNECEFCRSLMIKIITNTQTNTSTVTFTTLTFILFILISKSIVSTFANFTSVIFEIKYVPKNKRERFRPIALRKNAAAIKAKVRNEKSAYYLLTMRLIVIECLKFNDFNTNAFIRSDCIFINIIIFSTKIAIITSTITETIISTLNVPDLTSTITTFR